MQRLFVFVLSILAFDPALQAQNEPTNQSPPASSGQEKEVIIKTMEKGSGRILPRVEVRIWQKGFYTDANGQLIIMVPPSGGKILLQKAGFAKLFIEFEKLHQSSPFEAYLSPSEPDDDVVVIRADKRPEVSRKIITVEETKRVAPGGDPVQITKLMPGVVSDNFSQEVVIRGSGPYDSRYFVDDIEVPFIFHAIGNFSVMPDQLVSEVEFSSGGFGPQYGNATGGIIVLRTPDTVAERVKSEFRFNVPFFATAYHERPLSEDQSLAVSFRHSLTEFIIPEFIPEDADVTVVPTFADAHIRYLRRLDDGHLKFTLMGARDGVLLSAPFDEAAEEDGKGKVEFHTDFVTLGVEWLRMLGDGWSLKTTPQLSYSTMGFDILEDSLDGSIIWYGVNSEARRRVAKGQYLYIGVNPTQSVADFKVYAPVPEGDDPFFDYEDAPRYRYDNKVLINTAAAWVAYDQPVGKVMITPGLRYFYTDQIEKAAIDPRLSLRYPFAENHALKGAVGQYSIAPDFVETTKEFGNPDLGFEVSNHYIAGVESKWGERWVTDVQVFRKRTYHLIQSDGDERYKGNGTRLTDGFEVFVRRNMTEKFFGWLSYTYSESKERKTDSSPWYTSPYDQTHVLNLAGSYMLTALWDLGWRFKLNSGNPYTPVTGAVYNSGLDKYQPTYDQDKPYSKRLPLDNSLDIFATYESLYDTWKLSYRFGVQYIALAKRVTGVQRNYDYSKEELSSNQLPPIPFFELRGEF